MTGRTVFIDGLLAEVSSAVRRFVHSPRSHPIITLPSADRCDLRDTRGKWPLVGTRTGDGDTATLAQSFFGRSPWLHGQQA